MYYCYILRSQKHGRLYIGQTNDLKTRFKRHNAGQVESTRPYTPYIIIYYCAFNNQQDALACENYFKTTSGKKRIKHMLAHTLNEKAVQWPASIRQQLKRWTRTKKEAKIAEGVEKLKKL